MKVNQAMGFEHYQSYVQNVKGNDTGLTKAAVAEQRPESQEAVKMDKVDFSESGAARAGLLRLGAGIAQEVEASASAKRLAELTTQIQQGNYRVGTGEIADAIMGVIRK